MRQDKAQQKLVSFTNTKADMERIKAEIYNGWFIINLRASDGCYVGIMEQTRVIPGASNDEVFLPPRKKIF